MFGTNFLANNDILRVLIFSAFFLSIFYILGKVANNKFSVMKKNNWMNIPIGFSIYFLVTGLAYLIITPFDPRQETYYWLEIIKNSLIIVFVLFNYNNWVERPSKPSIDKLFSVICLFAIMVVHIVFVNYTNFYFSEAVPSPSTNINETIKTNFVSSQSGIYGFSVLESVKILTFLILPTITYSLIKALIKENDFNDYGIISLITSSLLIAAIGQISTQNVMVFLLLMISIVILSAYIYNDGENSNLLKYSILISFTTFFYSNSPLLIFATSSSIAMYISSKYTESPVEELLITLTAISLISLVLLNEKNILYLIFAGLISLAILTPLYSVYINRNSKALHAINTTLKESRRSLAIFFIVVINLFGLIVFLANGQYTASHIKDFYVLDNLKHSNIYNYLTFFSSISIILLISFVTKNNSLLYLPATICVIFNPVTILLLTSFASYSGDFSIITFMVLFYLIVISSYEISKFYRNR